MSLANGSDAQLQRGDEVMAKIPFEGVVSGELMHYGPRCIIQCDDGETVEVDEASIWRNGNGYAVRAVDPEEEL